MSHRPVSVSAPENHLWLMGEFVELLARQAPETVLDVGCGSGGLLRACAARGIAATGIDQAGPRLEALAADGFDVREGSAYELTLEDGAVDWVTMRHVPHHLEDPGRALAEALRVAKTGLLVAEPHFDVSVPSQRAALALDIWEKRQHRRGGMHHAEVFDLGGLLALLPGEAHSAGRLPGERANGTASERANSTASDRRAAGGRPTHRP
ncbi:MAG: class I SAM-dependent methyltransferase, partial [Planctomycetota bacterium]|nr:class I SAM-dependent methyltransferase [Planctomycetota bacterium]